MLYYSLGLHGFLLRKYANNRNFISISKDYNIIYTDFKDGQCILDFGCKCIDDYNYSLKCSLNNTYKLMDICNQYNMKYIFASTYGVFDPKNTYDQVKTFQEKIISSLDKYLIIRIPRVYGKSRNSGLMKFLRENSIYTDKQLEYCTLDYFHEQFENILDLDVVGTVNFKTNRKDWISRIKRLYR